jgi:plasmid stabilization system protein ParE
LSVPFEIRYLSTAENDLNDIFDYIIMDNPSAAVSMLEKFNHSISQLAFNPKLGVVSKDDRLQKMGYSILIIGKYLVFYVVKANTVQIRRIIHGARQYNFLL